jgi:hypothetical protein
MALQTETEDQITAALHILLKHRIVVIFGRQGVGKSTFAFNIGNSLSSESAIPLLGITGDQYRQHASFHPFQHQSYLESLRKSGGPVVRLGTAVAAAIDPTGRILYPAYQAIRGLISAQKTASTGFTKEEIEGARRFATLSKTQRVFLFDNFHFWDKSSLEFARKVIVSREPLGVYLIVVWTEHDVIESANSFSEVLSIAPRAARLHFGGMEKSELREMFLADLPATAADEVLKAAGANIPLVKTLSEIARKAPNEPDLAKKIANAAIDLKIDSLMEVPRIQAEQKALGCVAAIGPGASVSDIACALDLTVEETKKVLEWGTQHGLIDILDTYQVAFVHDLYQRLFDVDEILDPGFLERINVCCALGIPDEYEKRAAIASRGQDKDVTLSLVISLLRQRVLSWNETKSDANAEVERIASLIGGKYGDELAKLAAMFNDALSNASKGNFEQAAWTINVSGICSHPYAYLEEAVLFAHFAYLTRSNALRTTAIQKLESLKDTSQGEAERSFIIAMMLAYGLSLENKLKEATAVFAEEETRLGVSSDRFKEAPFYLAVCERMSLACYENAIARRRLERAFVTFQRLYEERGFLKRPDELLKCASNLCSAYVIGGMPNRAEEVLMSVETATQGIDFSWSTAPAFLSNNAMVAAIHRGLPDCEAFAAKWFRLAQENAHVKTPFLVNTLGCFLEAHCDTLGDLSASMVINELAASLEDDADEEAFTSYMAHFTTWQVLRAFDLVGDPEEHLKHASDLVLAIPYVNGDHFRKRHDALLGAIPSERKWSNQEWEQAAFGSLLTGELPGFYRRVVHFNPLEHWLPS